MADETVSQPSLTMTQQYQFHEAANIFPMLKESDLELLAADIKKRGLLTPILLTEGKILDGRNRYLACLRVGVEPRFEQWNGDDPYMTGWSLNVERRHLEQGSRAVLYLLMNQHREEWLQKRQALADAANRARSEAAKEQPRAIKPDGSVGFSGGISADISPEKERLPGIGGIGKGAQATAAAAHVSPAVAARAEALVNARPDLAKRVGEGEITLLEGLRLKKKDEVINNHRPLEGKYRVIYADPPWKYGDSRIELEGTTGAERHYPTMSIPDLCALPVKNIAEDNAVLFLWVTSPLLEECFAVIKAWGFEYKTSFIWDKVKHNMGHYNSVRHELLLVCTRGSCLPDTKELHDSVIEIERSDKHSEKPAYFRQLIDNLYTVGNRIELFSRSPAVGWYSWGNEAEILS